MTGGTRGWECASFVAPIYSLPYISFMVRPMFQQKSDPVHVLTTKNIAALVTLERLTV